MDRKNMLVSVVVIGSLWGIAEATLGYLMHIISLVTFYGFSGMIMSAVALYFIRMAVSVTRKMHSILYVAIIAAVIKLFDLFFPYLPATKIVNPAIAILSESLVAIFVWGLFFSKGKALKAALSMGVMWRVLYVVFVVIFNVVSTGKTSMPAGILSYLSNFVILQGILNGFLLYPVFKLSDIKKPHREFLLRPEYAIIAFSLAVSFELILKII